MALTLYPEQVAQREAMREARKQEAAAEPEAEKKPVGSLLPDAPVKRCTDDSGEAIWCGATLGLGLANPNRNPNPYPYPYPYPCP